MKLYAKVSSERASKGQGGNNFVRIELMSEDKLVVCDMQYWRNPNGTYELCVNGCASTLVFSQIPIDQIGSEAEARRCWAQVGVDDWCDKDAILHSEYCTQHSKQFDEKCKTCGETGGRHSDDACEPYKEKGKKKKGEHKHRWSDNTGACLDCGDYPTNDSIRQQLKDDREHDTFASGMQ